MMSAACTLLVNSYDGGEDLWEGFFTALTDRWPELDLPIVLNTESKSYTFPGLEIQTFGLYSPGEKIPWGKRMIDTLKRIDSEFVLFFLEDFWLDAPVDDAYFRECLQKMQENPDVAVLSFQRTHGPNIRDGRFERFEKRPQKAEYRFNCQAALWRRERLIKFMRPFESPWDWEIFGSVRSARYHDGFYTLIEGMEQVFSYDLKHGGAIHRGKWNKEVVDPFIERYNLHIDFSKRGFCDWDEPKPNFPSGKPTLWERLKRPHRLQRLSARIRNELKCMRSLI